MNTKPEPAEQETHSAPSAQSNTQEREYEQSGLYPSNGKSFRIVALLGSLVGVIVFLAIAAYALDRILI